MWKEREKEGEREDMTEKKEVISNENENESINKDNKKLISLFCLE